jgi:general secretion pathway protein J
MRHPRIPHRGGPATRRARGFTLIEVILATVLLAAGLALAFATLSAATRTAQRGEAMAQRNDHERVVENFLRKRLVAIRPVPFGTDGDSGLPQRFVGSADRMRFVADLPDYLGQGGPYLHDLAFAEDGRLTLALTMVLAGKTVEEREPRPPELLAEGLKSAHFRYRAMNEEGALGDWQDEWKKTDQLPLLIEVTLADANGRAWPPVVVALPLSTASVGAIAAPMETL